MFALGTCVGGGGGSLVVSSNTYLLFKHVCLFYLDFSACLIMVLLHNKLATVDVFYTFLIKTIISRLDPQKPMISASGTIIRP